MEEGGRDGVVGDWGKGGRAGEETWNGAGR